MKFYFDILYYRLINKEINNIKINDHSKKSVSVVICGRNEINNIKKNISLFLYQNYKDFELIFVDDGSKDNSVNFLKSKYPSIKVVETEDYNNRYKGKKNALMKGIEAASNEIILLSDIDCYPNSELWIKNMVTNFNQPNIEIVLGLSHYKTYKGSFLNKVIQYDGLITAINYISFSLRGKPYMGIGRNVAYLKSTFLKSKKLIETFSIASGDDDLLINDISNKNNTSVCLLEQSITISEPEKTWKKYINQKRRHYSTPAYYKKNDQIRLSFNYLSYFLYSFSIIFSILTNNIYILLVLITIKIICNQILLLKFTRIIQYSHLLWYSIILEIFLIGLQPIIYLSNILIPSKKWK